MANPVLLLSNRIAVLTFSLLAVSNACGRLGAEEIDFNQNIRPILQERCFACHGALKQEASLRLDSADLLRKGGDSGEIIDLEEVEQSELLIRVSHQDESSRMPPEGQPLSGEEIELIRQWIKGGGRVPENDVAEISPKEHWAFQVPRKGKLVLGTQANPIDTLLDWQRKQQGSTVVAGDAEKSLLLRRVYLDLIGVPPIPAEVDAFLQDESDEAYAKVVDQLLKSPHYGERWGRHWMDVWRYTDWYGLGGELRHSQKHLWHWRDWIVESLNADKGYDQMILEMLAADELYPLDRDRLRATGFLARNYYLFNRTTWLDSTLEHTGKAFLGLTLNCCKCHDHKYDPLTQEDYYRFRAIFEPHQVRMDPLPGTTDLAKDGLPRVFDAHPEAKTYLHIRGNEKDQDRSQPLSPGTPAFFDDVVFQPTQIALPSESYRPATQDFVLRDHLALLDSAANKAEGDLVKAQATLAALRSPKMAAGQTRYDSFKLETSAAWLDDSFDQWNDQIWVVKNGNWKVEKGQLKQLETGQKQSFAATSRIVESQSSHPQDFILETRISVTGGQKWKSLGIRFDASEKHEKTVYLSAFQDSKVQVSFSRQGKTTYPTEALAKIPVQLNQVYTLRVAIRNRLINVSVDGTHRVSFEFPLARQVGKIQLMSFDSLAAFDSIRGAKLPSAVGLIPANGKVPLTLTQAEKNLTWAESKVRLAQLKREKIIKGVAADAAKAKSNDPSAAIEDAVALTRQYEVANLETKVLELEFKRDGASTAEQEKITKSLEAEKKKLDAARKKSAEPGEQYDSIRVSRKALEGPGETAESRNQPFPAISTGRRTAFAKWLVDPANPLTSRVAVNQIWMRHFGKPLVDPVTDFGRRSKPPVQQQLLDWLAADLLENGWKMKRIHKLIMMSRAYRMSGQVETLAKDPSNEYYRFRQPLRMESQVVRDSLLRLSGQLEEKLGGAPIDPKAQAMSFRRSLYFRQSRDHQHKFVGMFDDVDILRCYRRQESIIPQQALTLANSKLAFIAASKINEKLSQDKTIKDPGFIDRSFRLILGRPPTVKELGVCLDSLDSLKNLSAGRNDSLQRSRTNLILALINSNDFVTIR
ncbi:MAG: PSD1 and planctomycete cytochrome C domain-containing protein [Planctomycetota bacterium]|nr:PSD1 and planctomycete cytochrome C domain-containing protein [Planctomycetota bacterium]